MATFNETHAPTSRTFIATEGILMPNASKTFQSFLWGSSVFPLEKERKCLNFQSFLPLTDPLVANVSTTSAPTSRKYVAEQGKGRANWPQEFKTFWSHTSVFATEKQAKYLNFHSFFTSKKPFGAYFQWYAWIKWILFSKNN